MNYWLEQLVKFDYEVLNNSEFKEDSVREEIIMPLIKALGYDYKGKYKIVRSRKLQHPFTMIGANKYKISIFPDYILECDGKCVCIIEAKAPSESLDNEECISQAYSYAVHREVAAKFYVLCNGKEFRLYSTSLLMPVMVFRMDYLMSHFNKLNAIMGAVNILTYSEKRIAKDLGIHLKMLSAGSIEQRFTFMDFPIYQIILVEPDTYTVDSTIVIDGEKYCGSFDFNYDTLLGLRNVLPVEALEKLKEPFEGIPIRVELIGRTIEVGIICKLGEKIYENVNEHYMPLRICDFQYAYLK